MKSDWKLIYYVERKTIYVRMRFNSIVDVVGIVVDNLAGLNSRDCC